MSDKQIRAHFKYYQIKTHVQTAYESHDLNMEFLFIWQWLQTALHSKFYARTSYIFHIMPRHFYHIEEQWKVWEKKKHCPCYSYISHLTLSQIRYFEAWLMLFRGGSNWSELQEFDRMCPMRLVLRQWQSRFGKNQSYEVLTPGRHYVIR